MKRVAIAAVGLALVVAMGGSTRGAAQSPVQPVTVFQSCSTAHPGSVAVTFSWRAPAGAIEQWVDLSLFDNGFRRGTFLGAGPLKPGPGIFTSNTFTWDDIRPGLHHFFRVNVLYPDGWSAVASGSFASIGDCPKLTASQGRVTSVECEGNTVHVTLTWVPGGGTSQWLDFAYTGAEMIRDSYWSRGPLAPGTSSFTLASSGEAVWRINTYSEAGWSPSPVWSFAFGPMCAWQSIPVASPTPIPPPPPPASAPQTGLTPPHQATLGQWLACHEAWWAGANVESLLWLKTSYGGDTSYLERQFQSLQTYVSSNCVGIGVRLASIPGAHGAWCFEMLGYGSMLSTLIDMDRRLGRYDTYFLDFAKREVDGFLAAARC